MPITVIVRSSAGGESARLTFDAAQRVVIGRGPGSDVRLPDATVSHRHATLRAQGADFVVVDEASTNGTFVGDVRVAARTSRIIRSGSTVRVGRLRLEIQIEQSPVTRDLGLATRDIALALVAKAMQDIGADPTTRVRVVEGRDQGAVLLLAQPGRSYVVGRGAHCDLSIADADASREHLHVFLREGGTFVRDHGAKNGTWLGEMRLSQDREILWRTTQMIQIGKTVLALEEPVSDALARIENLPDEPLAEGPSPPPVLESPHSVGLTAFQSPEGKAGGRPNERAGEASKTVRSQARRWSVVDGIVMAAALVVLVLSLAGMVWLLRG